MLEKFMKRMLIILVILQAASPVLAEGFDVSFTEGYAPISGYLQTPAGGKPGTSDIRRPTFGEVGVNNTTYSDVFLRYRKNQYAIYALGRFMDIDSSGVLKRDLTSQAQNFFEGEAYKFDTTFNFYHVGLQDDFGLLTGKIELALMDFHYKLRTSAALADRSYTKAGLRLGAEKNFKFDKIDIAIEASGSIPISNTPYIYSAGSTVKYLLTDRLNIAVGVQYFYLDYKDSQDLQNHLRLEMRPALSASLQFLF